MPRYVHTAPPIRYLSSSRRFYVMLHKKRRYLGYWRRQGHWEPGTPFPTDVQRAYNAAIDSWDPVSPSSGEEEITPEEAPLLVEEIIIRYWKHAQEGITPTSTAS